MRCTLVVDGLASATAYAREHVTYVEPGEHSLEAHFEDGGVTPLPVKIAAGESRELEAIHTPPVPPPAEAKTSVESGTVAPGDDKAASRKRLSPITFYVLGGATVAVGAVTIWSGIDLLNARDDFKKDPTPTRNDFDDGESKDMRTSVLIGSTCALAAATVVVALFTDFDGPSPAVAFDGHGAQLGLRGAF